MFFSKVRVISKYKHINMFYIILGITSIDHDVYIRCILASVHVFGPYTNSLEKSLRLCTGPAMVRLSSRTLV